MQPYSPTIVYRHRKENLKKCSLRGLEERTDFQFFTYPKQNLPAIESYIVLDLNAPPLSQEDTAHGLLIFDGTWRYAELMARQSAPQTQNLLKRSIPSTFRTAYPRKQEDCSDPERGLASVEAIFIAYHLMGRPTDGLLSNYIWKNEFLNKNNL